MIWLLLAVEELPDTLKVEVEVFAYLAVGEAVGSHCCHGLEIRCHVASLLVVRV